MKYSVIVPVYNEEEILKYTYERLNKVMKQTNEPFELIFVDDGSRDSSLSILKEFAYKDRNVKVVSFSKNFGHQNAVTCGMENAKGEAVVIIDCDLQDPPEVILTMIEKWKEGYDIVYGKRLKRKGESIFKKATASIYYRTVKMLGGNDIKLDTGDFRLIDRKVVNALNGLKEHNRFLRGLNCFVGFKQIAVEYTRDERVLGETKYTMKKMLKLASDGIVSSSSKPLTFAYKFGMLLLFLSIACFVTFLVLTLTNVYVFTPVYYILPTTTTCTAILLIFLGVTNIYLSRMLDECRNRPNYIVSEKINF